MRRFLALALILCALPVFSFASSSAHEFQTALFRNYCNLYELQAPPRPIETADLVMYSCDDYQLIVSYQEDENMFAVLTYAKKIDCDLFAYANCVILSFFDSSYQAALYDAIIRFRGNEGAFGYLEDYSGLVLLDYDENGFPYIAIKSGVNLNATR